MEGTMIEYRARGGLEYHNSPLGGTTMAECNDYSMQRHEDMKHCYSNPGTPPTLISIVSPQPIKVGTLLIVSQLHKLLRLVNLSGEFSLLPYSPTNPYESSSYFYNLQRSLLVLLLGQSIAAFLTTHF